MTSVIIFTAVFSMIVGVLDMLPSADSVQAYLYSGDTALSVFIDYIHCACYLLPMSTVITIFSIMIALLAWRCIVSAVATLWNLLPIV